MQSSDVIALDQYIVYNQLLTTRSGLIPVDITRSSKKINFIVKLNGKPVNSYIYSSFECLGLKVKEKSYKPQIFIDL